MLYPTHSCFLSQGHTIYLFDILFVKFGSSQFSVLESTSTCVLKIKVSKKKNTCFQWCDSFCKLCVYLVWLKMEGIFMIIAISSLGFVQYNLSNLQASTCLKQIYLLFQVLRSSNAMGCGSIQTGKYMRKCSVCDICVLQ